MPNTEKRAKAVREKLYGKTTKPTPMPMNNLKTPPPFQRAIDRRADKYKKRG